jgi:hypothetical protein
MSAGSAKCWDSAKHILLRWFDFPHSSSREEVVEMVESDFSEAVVCSSLGLSKDTRVSLTGQFCHELGIVRSCRAEGNKFMLTIGIGPMSHGGGSGIDPGVLAVEDFLTEEQEAEILNNLENGRALID